MKMRKTLHLFIAAVFALNQAVFLLVPLDQAEAQIISTTSNSSTIIFQKDIITNIDTETHYILMLDFISPQAKVSDVAYFSVKVSEEADVNFQIFYNGTMLKQFAGTYQVTDSLNNKIYYFKWPTLENANGNYTVKASARKSGYIDIFRQINVAVDNYQTALTANQTATTSDNLNYDAKSLEITFMEAYQPPFSGDKKITVSLSQEVDNVIFTVEGMKNEKWNGARIDAKTYYFIWHTADYPNNYYKVTANAVIKDAAAASKSFSAQTENKIAETVDQPLVQPFAVASAGKLVLPIAGDYKIIAKANQKADKVDFTIAGPRNEKFSGIRIDDYQFYFIWPTAKFPNGQYNINIAAYQTNAAAEWRGNVEIKNAADEPRPQIIVPVEMKQPVIQQEQVLGNIVMVDCKQAGITTEEDCKKFLSLPPECRDKGMTGGDQCEKFLSIPPECRGKNLSKEECDKYMAIPPECRAQGILDMNKCREFTYKNAMPAECQKAGAKTQEECSKIILNNSLPIECQKAGANSKEECGKLMFVKNSPTECKEANISNPEECGKYMEKINLPSECAEAGIKTQEECDKFMFKKHAPADCISAGITNGEACNKFMYDKSGDKNVSINNMPAECSKAGVKTGEECNQLMKKLFMPQDCQSQGITDGKECSAYMESKYMTEECRTAGAKSQSECDKIMFKKYAPAECRDAGITDGKECNDFMFNKYAPQVRCDNVEDWQCKNSVQADHLGDIVFKQTQFSEIREKIIPQAGASMTVQELNAQLETANEIIPFKNNKTNLRIVATQENIILNESNNLIQTSPVAVMIDTDGDGLPDDLEKRMGTNPNVSDTDGDGYSDGAEVKNNYNPAGEGEIKTALAPIDEAIMQNKTLSQPKAEGAESDKLSVGKIKNKPAAGADSEGYIMNGKAEPNSVVTLYIYSDLPLVATAKADEFGNWQYELGDALNEGEHEIYVAVNDNTGKVLTKSKPLNFFIKEAKAVSIKDFVAPAPQTQSRKTDSMLKYYIYISSLITALGVALFVAYHAQSRKKFFK